jgi:hypothetical protein
MAAYLFEDVLFTLMVLFQCDPIQKAWEFVIPGRCLNTVGYFKAETTFSLGTNLLILLLPMPTLWKLHMVLRRRLLLIAIFAIGLM